MTRLKDKRCVVTGAGRGIGAAIVRHFKNEGARVVVTDRDGQYAADMARDIGAAHMHLDVQSEADWAALGRRYPTIDVLVNNAGVTGLEGGETAHDPETASLADWHRVFAINADGAFLGCQFALRAMRRNGGGAIVNVASHAGKIGVPDAAAYAASKAAILSLTKSVALYGAREGLGIRCNAVLPGAVLTDMWEPMLGDGADRQARMDACVADTPLARFGSADEIAAIVCMLASDDSSYITGAEVTVDGGLSAG